MQYAISPLFVQPGGIEDARARAYVRARARTHTHERARTHTRTCSRWWTISCDYSQRCIYKQKPAKWHNIPKYYIINLWPPLLNQFLKSCFVALTSSNKKTDHIFRNFRKSFRNKCVLNFWIWDGYHCLICPWKYPTSPTSRSICEACEPLKIVLLPSGSSLGSYLSGLIPCVGFYIQNRIVLRQNR